MPSSVLSSVSTTDLRYAEKFSAPHTLDKTKLRRLIAMRSESHDVSDDAFEQAVSEHFHGNNNNNNSNTNAVYQAHSGALLAEQAEYGGAQDNYIGTTPPRASPPRASPPRASPPRASPPRANTPRASPPRMSTPRASPAPSVHRAYTHSPHYSRASSRAGSRAQSRAASVVDSHDPAYAGMAQAVEAAQMASLRQEREMAERRFYFNELESLRSSGVQVGEFSMDNPAHDLEFRLNHTQRLESEKESQESAEQFFKIGLRLLELGNRKVLKGVLPLQNFSRDTIKDIDRFRPVLRRIAKTYMGSAVGAGEDENPIQQLGKMLVMHMASFCLTKYLRGTEEPAVAAAASAGPPPATSRRPVLAPP